MRTGSDGDGRLVEQARSFPIAAGDLALVRHNGALPPQKSLRQLAMVPGFTLWNDALAADLPLLHNEAIAGTSITRTPAKCSVKEGKPARRVALTKFLPPPHSFSQRGGGLMAGNSAEPGRSVTSKVVAILLTFHDGNEHSLTEIARLTCLPVSTAHRLVSELAGWGVLERTDDSRFRVGLPIKAIGTRRPYTPAIIESARRVLEDLVTAARTCARFGILTDTGVAYIEKQCDHSPVTTFAQTRRLPAHATALGKALLAFSSDEMVDRIIANGLERYTPNTLTDPERVRRCLASIRLTRVAISRWELEPGVSEVAVPVFGSGGMAVAALELTVPNLRTDLHMASSVLTVAARGLSRELAIGSHVGCFAPITEQHGPNRIGREEPDRKLIPALSVSLHN